DIAAAIFVLVLALVGWGAGAVHQVWRLAAFAAAFGLARAVGPEMALFYLGKTDSTPLAATTVCFFVAFGAFWAVASLVVRRLAGAMRDLEHDRSHLDRALGALLGAARGAALVVLLLMGLAAHHEDTGRLALPYLQSRVGQLSAERDFLKDLAIDLEARHLVRLEEAPAPRDYPSATGLER